MTYFTWKQKISGAIKGTSGEAALYIVNTVPEEFAVNLYTYAPLNNGQNIFTSFFFFFLVSDSPCIDSGEAGSLSIRPSASLAVTINPNFVYVNMQNNNDNFR